MDSIDASRLIQQLGRIAAATESIAASLKNQTEVRTALDDFEDTLGRAFAAIKASRPSVPVNEGDVTYAVATLEYKRLGFGSPEALLEARAER